MSPEKLNISDISERHIKDILEIEVECGLSQWTLKGHLEELRRDDSITISALLEKRVVGFIIVRLNLFEEAEILNFAVRKTHQKRGIGRKLLEQALARASEKGDPKRVWLEVRESNETAIKFYLDQGFLSVGKRKGFYASPREDAIVMKKEIEAESEWQGHV